MKQEVRIRVVASVPAPAVAPAEPPPKPVSRNGMRSRRNPLLSARAAPGFSNVEEGPSAECPIGPEEGYGEGKTAAFVIGTLASVLEMSFGNGGST